jgi:hypothetical protein
MKKLAIFVEGKTERIFVERLISQLISARRYQIEVREAFGGSARHQRVLRLIYRTPDSPAHEFYVLIVESCNDDRVASDVRDSYDTLAAQGFSCIVAIRDVFPNVAADEIPTLRRMLRFRIRTTPIDPVFILGVMEVEAWFVAEHNHFPQIHANITCSRILATFGYDPSTHDCQQIACPHDDLHNIYQLESLVYQKRGAQIQNTVNVLDYAYIYLDMVNRFPDLRTLVNTLDAFFATP